MSYNEVMGVNLKKDGPIANIDKFKSAIRTTSRKYREEMSKYKEIATFNKQLSLSYIQNLEAMVDVSRVFGYYIELFNVLKNELDENAKVLGSSAIKAEDIAYIEGLTQTKMDTLNKKFLEETAKMKKLYENSEYQGELDRIKNAEKSIVTINNFATSTLDNLKKINETSVRLNTAVTAQGGAKTRVNARGNARKTNTQTKKNK